MAKPRSDYFLPSLLDRLTDDKPREKNRNEALRDWGQSHADYRRSVLRDLKWLLNAHALPPSHPIYDYPEVASSVLNYGIRDITGLTRGSFSTTELEKEIRDAIVNFEPRILEETVSVRAYYGIGDSDQNALVLEITGDLWAEPMPLHLQLRSELDLETGIMNIKDN